MSFKQKKVFLNKRPRYFKFNTLIDLVKNHLTTMLFIALFVTLILSFWPESGSTPIKIKTTNAAKNLEVTLPVLDLTGPGELNSEELESIRAEYCELQSSFIHGNYRLNSSLKRDLSHSNYWITRHDTVLGNKQEFRKSGGPVESVELANPGLFIYPRFTILHPLSPNIWSSERINKSEALRGRSFQYEPKVRYNRWNPGAQVMEASFDLSDFLSKSKTWMSRPLELRDLKFRTSTFNAFDFGFYWMKISKASSNIVNPDIEKVVSNYSSFEITKSPPCFDSEIGCNYITNINFPAPIEIQSLPAKVVFYLWSTNPENLDQPPDVVYELIFE